MKSGWPSMAAIAAASGRRRQTVWEHFQNARFAAWFDAEMDRFMASGADESPGEVRRTGDGRKRAALCGARVE